MITIRRAEERGHADHGWLDTYHTFSFADYHDADHMGFRSLRVINEDRVAPGRGFGTHGHRDMEIISYVLDGALAHRDSMGTDGVIRPGEVQRMSAGTGVMHSEMNGSDKEGVHFLQIWIVPERRNITPSYEQKAFPADERRGTLRLVAAPDAADGAVKIHQDVRLYLTLLDGETVTHDFAPGRYGWIQVTRGEVEVNGQRLKAGDGAAIADERSVTIGGSGAEVLLFDLN
ncbi:MAG TPA: pirin family protein [Thermoanaerobaculia bacterium]|nr:pirin family protein [Thermoanaerobaculia bacterium]